MQSHLDSAFLLEKNVFFSSEFSPTPSNPSCLGLSQSLPLPSIPAIPAIPAGRESWIRMGTDWQKGHLKIVRRIIDEANVRRAATENGSMFQTLVCQNQNDNDKCCGGATCDDRNKTWRQFRHVGILVACGGCCCCGRCRCSCWTCGAIRSSRVRGWSCAGAPSGRLRHD